jgi:hypothetical protein
MAAQQGKPQDVQPQANTADPQVSIAFALGWQVAELYRPPDQRTIDGQDDEDLPGLGALAPQVRIEILVDQIQAALSALRETIQRAGLPTIDLDALRASLLQDEQARRQAVGTLHGQIIGSLTAADFRLGKAYRLGRALADACRKPTDHASLQAELSKDRISKLLRLLDDLASAFPPHAAHSVYGSLERWETAEADIPLLRRQGELWRALLSGEKLGTEMLEIGNYLDAAHQFARQMRAVLRGVIVRFPILVVLIVGLLALGVVLLATGGSSKIVAGASSLIAALGLTWKGLGGALSQLVTKLEQPLWGAVIDVAITDAITLLPDNKLDRRGRRAVALQASTAGR